MYIGVVMCQFLYSEHSQDNPQKMRIFSTKQQASIATSDHPISCCLITLHFLMSIQATLPYHGTTKRILIQVAEKLLRQKKKIDNDDDDDDFVATPAKTKSKTRVKSRRQSSFAPSPAITPIAEEREEEYMLVPGAGAKDTGLTGKYWTADAAAEGGPATPEKGMSMPRITFEYS